jgi:hypothetical protein
MLHSEFRLAVLTIFLAGASLKGKAQELFPNSEPASIVPKKAIGVRLMNEAYNNSANLRIWNGTMIMYGVSSKFMLSGMITGSNHHGKQLGESFVARDLQDNLHVKPKPQNTIYPYLFESVGLGFRYRFVNVDADHKHFRMAVYGNGTYANRPHDEAEVTAMGDNKGISGGIISTILLNRLAVSLTTGAIRPFDYKESQTAIELNYGNAYNYSLSFGYLLYPRRYKSFNQTNINLYTEFLGKTYADMTVKQGLETASTSGHKSLQGGNYIEFRPAVQFIVKSNLRIDVGTALPLVGQSDIRKYPSYQVNIQYYFFR